MQAGVRLIPCSGFDSVPFDIGTFVTTEYMKHAMGQACTNVQCFIGKSKGGVSGGTIHTMIRYAGHLLWGFSYQKVARVLQMLS
jgi:short subunit dehydrogenase-like uncharacterized protein